MRDGTEQRREPDLGVPVDFLATQQQQMMFPERIAQGTAVPSSIGKARLTPATSTPRAGDSGDRVSDIGPPDMAKADATPMVAVPPGGWTGKTTSMTQRVPATLEQGVLEIRLNRAENNNTLTPAICGALAEAILDCDRAARVLWITGNGNAFASGNNVKPSLTPRPGATRARADRFLLATAILEDPDDHGNQRHGHRRGGRYGEPVLR